jgi:hypothetical protein
MNVKNCENTRKLIIILRKHIINVKTMKPLKHA